jgi:hypothetical protein
MKLAHRLAILLLTVLPSLPAAAALQAWLAQDRVELGEAVELTLQRDGRGDSEPDLTPLKQDFAIVGRASGSSIQITNGRMTTQAQLRLTLAPKHDGRIPIPPLNWDGQWSPALALTVAANAPQAGSVDGRVAAPGSPVFLSSTLGQKQPYVQAATALKLRIYTDQPLYQASLDLPSSNDVVVRQIGKDRQGSEVRDGRSYQVIERDYLLFPQRSGRISLPGAVLEAQVADTRAAAATGDPFDRAFGSIFGRNPFAGMMNMTRPLRLQGDAIILDARPRPAGVAGQDWLPAQQLSLDESWRPDSASVRAGEPFTRHLRLSAVGLSAAQLPDLAARMPLPDGIKAYPDQPGLSDDVQGDGIHGRRDQDIALIASRPGHYQIPAMRVAWWDTAQNSPREVVLPARSLEILPGAGGSGSPPPVEAAPVAPSTTAASAPNGAVSLLPAANAMASSAWPWVSVALGLLWLTTLAAWWRARRPAATTPANSGVSVPGTDPIRAGAARKAFRQACNDNDAAAARRHLLDWAHAVWPHDAPAGLNALARRLGDPVVSALLRKLDRACYAGGDWRGKPLAEALAAMPDTGKRAELKTPELAGLYP